MNYRASKVSWCPACTSAPEGELCRQHSGLGRAKQFDVPGKCDFCDGHTSDVGGLLRIDKSELFSCHPCFDSGRSHVYNPQKVSRKEREVKFYTGKNPFRVKTRGKRNDLLRAGKLREAIKV